ncbi:MAG TPA: hypothetical protein VK545_26375, partial [Streptomyces sp.]|nr:hypothetical protein [Streptomyces sp.]
MKTQDSWFCGRSRRARMVTGVLAGSLAGSLVLGGALMLLPDDRPPVAPTAGPAAARAAVTKGVPAAPADLSVLIGDREAHLRKHPRDAGSWALLGAAYVEQGRRTADAGY